MLVVYVEETIYALSCKHSHMALKTLEPADHLNLCEPGSHKLTFYKTVYAFIVRQVTDLQAEVGSRHQGLIPLL